MTDSRGFRFSTNVFGLTSRAEFASFAQRVEALGYDTLFAADHLASYAPFQMAVAAAQATSRIRLGTLVINVPFWNPALLAREIATADILTDGRLEVGLGSGHMKWEFDAASIPWEGFGGKPPGTLRLCSAAEADDVVRFARAQAGDRADDVEWNVLVQLVKVTGDRRAVAAELEKDSGGTLSAEAIMETPFLLFGTVDEIAGQITRNRERYGFTYYTVHAPYAEEFAAVIERLRAS